MGDFNELIKNLNQIYYQNNIESKLDLTEEPVGYYNPSVMMKNERNLPYYAQYPVTTNITIPKIKPIDIKMETPPDPIYDNSEIKPIDENAIKRQAYQAIFARKQQARNRASKAGDYMSMAGKLGEAAFGENDYSGEKGDMTLAMDTGYDATKQVVGQLGPWGKMAAGIMDINAGLGNAFGQTDKTNKIDAAFDSKFTPFFLKWINSSGARTVRSGLSAQEDDRLKAFGQGAYGDTGFDMIGKKVGRFAKKYYNRYQNKVNQYTNSMLAMANQAELQGIRSQGMASQNAQNYYQEISGGADQVERGSKGMKITKSQIERFRNVRSKVQQFKKGGKEESVRDLNELVQVAIKNNPRFVQRFFEEPKAIEFTDDKGNTERGSHQLSYSTIDNYDVVFPSIQEDENGNLKYYTDWEEALSKAKEKGDYLILNKGEGPIFTENYKKSAFFKPFFDKWELKYGDYEVPISPSQTIVETKITPVFKKGGHLSRQMNVIPEGALHAHKNHMELADEGEITHKGIPVIDNDGNQQAEIEREEIIFNKDTTDKIEKWYKEFFDEESKSDKDELSIKCGKFLVNEILFNTEDRVGLIEKLQNNGD